MALSAALQANLSSKFCFVRLYGIQNRVALVTANKRKGHRVWIIKSVLHNRNSSFSDNGAAEPARILLERLFDQKQKLEEQMGRDFSHSQEVQLGFNLGNLESDLQAALAALKKKEEDLQEAEMQVMLDYSELNQAKEELEMREEEILAAASKHKQLEEELKQANLNLATKATDIEDLKLQLKERDQEISMAQSALSLKEEEINKMMKELMKKSEDAENTKSELQSKDKLLNAANDVVKKQELELQELQKRIQMKEEELGVSMELLNIEKEKLKVAEVNLEKQTMDWLLSREELKKLAEEASRKDREVKETLADFRRVKKLLASVRFELVSSQKALSSSRDIRDEQEKLIEKQRIELEEQKRSVMSYLTSLKDAQIEVESEKVKLKAAEARNQELELDLSLKKELIKELQEELNEEKSSVQKAIGEMSFLQEQLEKKISDFEEAQKLLQAKEAELVEARLEIQHLKSEQASLQLILEEKNLELSNTRKMLEDVNQEIAELRILMHGREDQLIQATTMLKETEEHVQTIQHELSDTKLKYSEAETVVERIAELTKKLVTSPKDENYDAPNNLSYEMEHKSHQLLEKPNDIFRWQKKQLENELEITRESLRLKEMEVLAGQRVLTIKDKELEMVLGRLDEREKELKKTKEEFSRDGDDLRKLYTLAQERIGEKSVGELAIEKLQLEAAQLEVEAATSALQKLSEMSRELIDKASLSMEVDYDMETIRHDVSETGTIVNNGCLSEVETELARLSVLTDQLVKQAGIVGDVL